MKLLFIGTSSGKTDLNRFHSSILFSDSQNKILVDAGDGISKALLNQGIEFNSITDIILSHYHSDHLAGLPSLITQMIINNRKGPLNIYTNSKLVNPLKDFLQTSYIFIEKLKFKVKIIPFNFNNQTDISNTFSFEAKQNSHIVNKHNSDVNPDLFISSSFLFNLDGKKVVYTSDIGSADDLFLFNKADIYLFISEVTHVAYAEIEKASLIIAPQKMYLTHIDNENLLNNWYSSLSDYVKESLFIASDGTSITI